MRILIGMAVVAVAALMLAVRLWPIDPGRVHTASRVMPPGNVEGAARFSAARQITTTPEAILTALDRVILATPRTKIVAGMPAEGRISYVTRSRVFGFPDYTTIEIVTADTGPVLVLRGWARFAGSDFGVNKARINGWLAQLGPLIVPLP